MSKCTSGCSSMSPCCRPAQLVVDEFCENFNVSSTMEVIWADTSPQDGIFTLSLAPDSDASATVTIIQSAGESITYMLLAGESRTDVIPNASSLSVTSFSTVLLTTGKACITIYRKIR
ncbi:hypothetical protein Q0N71_27920 [Bacillus thuringiensis]|uniref:S-Ena type endospore appendage n=1 Tax=Bacillus thuringiensis TaxID=1428 RepID=UPI0034592EC4